MLQIVIAPNFTQNIAIIKTRNIELNKVTNLGIREPQLRVKYDGTGSGRNHYKLAHLIVFGTSLEALTGEAGVGEHATLKNDVVPFPRSAESLQLGVELLASSDYSLRHFLQILQPTKL